MYSTLSVFRVLNRSAVSLLVTLTLISAAAAMGQGILTIQNVDRPSLSPNFFVGDHYRYQIYGAATNQPVSDYVCRLGVFCTWQDFGYTDENGYAIVEGYDPPDNQGDYEQTWYVAGGQVGPILHFWVRPLSTGGVTLLVNGSFDDSPDWVHPESDIYPSIANTFGTQPLAYSWTPNSQVIFPYIDILAGGSDFASFVNGLNLDPSIPLSIVAHSHGGNVVKIASYSISRPINFLINLGTPQNWDFVDINPSILQNYCQVSSFEDYVQFFGSSIGQVGNWSYDQYATGVWLDQEALDLYNGDYDLAAYDAEQIAYFESDASAWWFSAKLAYYATNVMLGSESHSDLHTAAVWNGDVKPGCGLPN